ncbi:MAG: palmitoyl-CoA hydrolase [Ramlibacter sp.]|nr:palmitoyl-CoA hydrolase [Ramlibacter sp.]
MSAELHITPREALIDVPRRIAVTGLRPGEEVTLASRTVRGPGLAWRARARWRADAAGTIDLTRDAPQAGSNSDGYDAVSAMGLVWSQVPDLAAGAAATWAQRDVFDPVPWAPLTTHIEVLRDGPGAAALAGTFVQRLAGDGVTRREVREDGLVGTLFLPPGQGPHPAVVVLNGSGGGINEPRAALYASHGYASLALGYFKAPGLPDHISNTRLEYFETALAWVHRTLRPRHGFVALSGQSRGGELVLLLGTLLPDAVSAVIGYVPGAVVHPAQNACDPALGREGPAWLWRGQPLVDVWQGNRTATWAPWDSGPEPRRHAAAILTALDDPEAVARARIPVEKIRGPVLVVSGTDDGSWPSSRYGRMVAERLAQVGHPHAVCHLDHQGAGHAIVFPYVPTTQLTYAHPVSGRLSTSGGTPAANARADEASWPGVLQFLADAVAARAASRPPH